MSEEKELFVERIIRNLECNGFPAKKVSLPTDKVFEAADKLGFSFNQVIDELKDKGIQSDIGADKIVFSQVSNINPLSRDFDPSSLKGMDQDELMKKAQEFMSTMTPDQMEEMQKMYQNMSDEEKEEVMKKGKEMGLA